MWCDPHDDTLGNGQWAWSGIWSNDGNLFSDVPDSRAASLVFAPSYTDVTDGVMDGTVGDTLSESSHSS